MPSEDTDRDVAELSSQDVDRLLRRLVTDVPASGVTAERVRAAADRRARRRTITAAVAAVAAIVLVPGIDLLELREDGVTRGQVASTPTWPPGESEHAPEILKGSDELPTVLRPFTAPPTLTATPSTEGGGTIGRGASSLPGGDEMVPRSPARTFTRTGPADVDLGERPAGTTSAEMTFTCLTAGSFTIPGGGMTCSPDDAAEGAGARPGPTAGPQSAAVAAAASR
ncbi:MAG TPA: hypothetical protein VF661_04110 [Actinomycetales bacterium]|jgi:hypothetical protein